MKRGHEEMGFLGGACFFKLQRSLSLTLGDVRLTMKPIPDDGIERETARIHSITDAVRGYGE